MTISSHYITQLQSEDSFFIRTKTWEHKFNLSLSTSKKDKMEKVVQKLERSTKKKSIRNINFGSDQQASR